MSAISEEVREACARVAPRSRSVRIDEAAIEAYAATLPAVPPPTELDPATHPVEGDREGRAAFVVCLDAINFGSGWWPTIRKRAGRSGHFTVAAGLTERFRESGAWSAPQLADLAAADLATALGQDPDHPLMADFAAALRDVGGHVAAEHGGSFLALAEAGGDSALSFAGILAGWDAFADVSTYEERPVPFFKRAQLATADLARAGVVQLGDLDRLTAFADNLVPHVLRVDGVLHLDPAISEAIDAGELLAHGSAEEVELRACGVHAIELLSAATGGLSPAQIDTVLWNRGGGPRYKERPRPRCRNTAY